MKCKLRIFADKKPREIRRVFLLLIMLIPTAVYAQDDEPSVSFDGLVQVMDARVEVAWVNPDADFSVFRRVSILQPYVAFRSNWLRDQNRTRNQNIRASDVERIKEDVANQWLNVFTERLEAAGYEVVNVADDDVLILRPAIIDLDITAPDVRTAGRSRDYRSSAGAATLFLELYDSVTGQILGRAIDRRVARSSGGFAVQSNRVTNRADARREFAVWADRLIEFLNEHYVAAEASE